MQNYPISLKYTSN